MRSNALSLKIVATSNIYHSDADLRLIIEDAKKKGCPGDVLDLIQKQRQKLLQVSNLATNIQRGQGGSLKS